MSRIGWLVLAGLLAWPQASASAADPAVLAAERERVQVMARVAPSVVAIFASGGDGGGSGVLISPDGYALSNFHVTSGAGEFMKCGLNDGSLNDAVIVGIDPTGDVALIKLLNRQDYPYASFGDSDRVQVGDWVFAMGNPFLLATDYSPTVTYGIVSGMHRYQYPAGTILEYADCIQVDASINPGNSGGPLFNAKGELIGINGRGSFDKRGRVNSGAGYAISINQIKLFLDALKSGRVVDHATLGATVRAGSDRTVVVDNILENSDAYRRGLREGDEIVSLAGRPIGSVNQFKNVLGIFPKGWTVPLVFRRDGLKHEVLVMLRGLHRQSELAPRRASQPQAPPEDAPLPDDAPPDDPQNDEPKKDEPSPRKRRDAPPGHAEASIPEEFRHWYEPKDGFANFHFNQLEQERVWRAMSVYDSWKAAAGRWKITGKTLAGVEYAWTLADQGIGLTIGQTPYFQSLEPGADPLDEPPGTGGLLIAFHQFRMLLTKGRGAFSDFYYLGSEPLDGGGELVDVLVSRKDGLETRWYFRRSQPRLIGFDSQLAADTDPAKIRWLDEGNFRSRAFPAKFQVQCGDRVFATFVVETFEVAGGGNP